MPGESARFIGADGDRHEGVTRRIAVPAPAAGADWTFTVPSGVVWKILTVRAQLTASAVVANRQPRLVITDGTFTLATVEAAASIVASATVAITWVAGGLTSAAGVSGNFPGVMFPGYMFETGWTIATTTTNKDAGDQWSNIVMAVEERFEQSTELSERVEAREQAERAWYEAIEHATS